MDDQENEVTASEVIAREHELIGESRKPSKKEKRIHRQLRKEFDKDDDDDSITDYDFTKSFKKIMRG